MERYRLKDFFKDATDMVFVGFLFSATVVLGAFVTFGAAFKALFAVTFRIMEGKKATRIFHDFFTAFRDSFWFSTLAWLVSAGLGAVLYFGIRYAMAAGLWIVAASAVVTAVLLITYLLYLFPMLAAFTTDKPGTMLKNAFLMAAGHPFSSLLLLGGMAVAVLLFELWYGTVLVSPAIVAAVNGFHLRKLFGPHLAALTPPETEAKD